MLVMLVVDPAGAAAEDEEATEDCATAAKDERVGHATTPKEPSP